MCSRHCSNSVKLRRKVQTSGSQPGVILPTSGYLAMSGDTCRFSQLSRGCKGQMFLDIIQCTGQQPPQQRVVGSARAQELWFLLKVRIFPSGLLACEYHCHLGFPLPLFIPSDLCYSRDYSKAVQNIILDRFLFLKRFCKYQYVKVNKGNSMFPITRSAKRRITEIQNPVYLRGKREQGDRSREQSGSVNKYLEENVEKGNRVS